MQRSLSLAWTDNIRRVHVHTCTLDHPAALDFYRAHGFAPYARAVESFADPRLAGILSETAAPGLPLIGQVRARSRLAKPSAMVITRLATVPRTAEIGRAAGRER